jgi:hypothetical protein
VKLAFVDKGAMYAVDFSAPDPSVQSMDSIQGVVIAPDISPDGGWVVFAAPGTDGRLESDIVRDSTIKSSAWMCRLQPGTVPRLVTQDSAHVPRFVKNSAGLEVIYSTKGGEDTWDKGVGQVRRKAVGADGTPADSETVVFNGFSCFGGMSYDGRYLATGPNRACMVDLEDPLKQAVSVHRLRLNVIDSIENVPHDSITVCNPSVSSSRYLGGAMLYIDLGSGGWVRPGINDGKPWKMHEIIFIATYDHRGIRAYCQPGDVPIVTVEELQADFAAGGSGGGINYTEWDHCEWSNHPYYAVSALFASRTWKTEGEIAYSLRNEYLYAINLKDSTFLQLLHSGDTTFAADNFLQWPVLWVAIDSGFAEDESWLESRMQVKGPPDRGRERRGVRVCIDRGNIVCTAPIRRIEICTPAGQILEVREIGGPNVRSVLLGRTAGLGSGVRILRIRTRDGTDVHLRVADFNGRTPVLKHR